MINVDEDALVCDMAETYHIYDYRSLPCSRAAVFAAGLRDNSRIKMEMAGTEISMENILSAMAVDNLSIVRWLLSEDGKNGKNRPSLVLSALLGGTENRNNEVFDSPDAFEEERKKILGKEG